MAGRPQGHLATLACPAHHVRPGLSLAVARASVENDSSKRYSISADKERLASYAAASSSALSAGPVRTAKAAVLFSVPFFRIAVLIQAPQKAYNRRVPNSMPVAFQQEPWTTIRKDIWPLWQMHYAEIAEDKERIPLDPDWHKYDSLAKGGHLQIVAARKDSDLVGYVFAMMDTHLHYRSTLVAQFDLYWLRPECRGGRTAWRMFEEMDRHLASLGVVKVFGNTKLAHDQGRLFRAMGWREAERLFVKTPGN